MNPRLRTITLIILCTLLIIVSAGCSSKESDAVQAIEKYIQALSARDSVRIGSLSCTDWEQEALVEIDSLTALGSTVENLACEQIGQDGNDVLVSCTGVLALDYNGEIQEIDLSSRTYIARQEDAEWRMCGYK